MQSVVAKDRSWREQNPGRHRHIWGRSCCESLIAPLSRTGFVKGARARREACRAATTATAGCLPMPTRRRAFRKSIPRHPTRPAAPCASSRRPRAELVRPPFLHQAALTLYRAGSRCDARRGDGPSDRAGRADRLLGRSRACRTACGAGALAGEAIVVPSRAIVVNRPTAPVFHQARYAPIRSATDATSSTRIPATLILPESGM